jgi:tetratricopeptide (TPR) repeat protein
MFSPNARLAFFATLLITAQARAQTSAPEPAPAAEVQQVEQPRAPEPPPESPAAVEARTAVARAKALFAVGDYSAALAEFTRAHDLLQGDPRQPDVLNNIAVCYERMFRYDLALSHYERYLRESTTATAEDRAEVQAAMIMLRDLLGTVRVTGLAGADVWIDDRKLGQVPLDVLVPAGLHVIEVRARNHESQRRELRVTARATHTVDARLEKVDTYKGLPSTYFWIGAGLTGAALITGSVFGIATLNERAERQRDADRGIHVDAERSRRLALQADIAFGATLALGVGTAVLYFLTDWHAAPRTERQPPPTGLSLDLTMRSAGMSWRSELP